MTYEIFYIYDVKKKKTNGFPDPFLFGITRRELRYARFALFFLVWGFSVFCLFCYFLSAFGFWRSIAFWVEGFSDFLVLFFLVLIFQFF